MLNWDYHTSLRPSKRTLLCHWYLWFWFSDVMFSFKVTSCIETHLTLSAILLTVKRSQFQHFQRQFVHFHSKESSNKSTKINLHNPHGTFHDIVFKWKLFVWHCFVAQQCLQFPAVSSRPYAEFNSKVTCSTMATCDIAWLTRLFLNNQKPCWFWRYYIVKEAIFISLPHSGFCNINILAAIFSSVKYWPNNAWKKYFPYLMTLSQMAPASLIISSRKTIFIMLNIHVYCQSLLCTNGNTWVNFYKMILAKFECHTSVACNVTVNSLASTLFRTGKSVIETKTFFTNIISHHFWKWKNKWSPSPISCSLKTSPGPNHRKRFPFGDPEREMINYPLWIVRFHSIEFAVKWYWRRLIWPQWNEQWAG